MIKPSNIQPNLIAQISPKTADMIKVGAQTSSTVEDDLLAMWGEIASQMRQ